MNRPESECELQEQLLSDEGCTLMLYNDNTNTFDFVIDSLMECCGHSYEQALQCTWIALCFGKCDVKHSVTWLGSMRNTTWTYAKLGVPSWP